MDYNEFAKLELDKWKYDMKKKPSIFDMASKGIQNKFNGILPNKYHEFMTIAIKNMVKAVLFGSTYLTKEPCFGLSLKER